jgi:hypothetical protein
MQMLLANTRENRLTDGYEWTNIIKYLYLYYTKPTNVHGISLHNFENKSII